MDTFDGRAVEQLRLTHYSKRETLRLIYAANVDGRLCQFKMDLQYDAAADQWRGFLSTGDCAERINPVKVSAYPSAP